MDTLISEEDKNKSSPPIEIQTSHKSNGIISTGSPYCESELGQCSNRSVPGSKYCGPHKGKLTLRADGTLGIIGPGCYRAIATLAKLNHRYVSQVLQGKSNPTSNVLSKIAAVVGVDVGWLVDYIDEQKNGNG
jgi:hypothetical protein